MDNKFNIGDVLWYASTNSEVKKHPCPDCLEEGVWKTISPAGNEYETRCPRCNCNHGPLNLRYQECVPHARPLTIGSVRYDSNDTVPFKYMCVETGIGSGNVYEEKDLYFREDMALDVAKLRAAEANEKQKRDLSNLERIDPLYTYQLENALIKDAKDTKTRIEVKVEIFLDDLRDCVAIEDVKRIIEEGWG